MSDNEAAHISFSKFIVLGESLIIVPYFNIRGYL